MEKWIGSKKQVVYPISMRYVFKKHLPNLEIWPKYSPFSLAPGLEIKCQQPEHRMQEKIFLIYSFQYKKDFAGFPARDHIS